MQRELVRYATLAPSSHNTQCWRFTLEDGRILISADFSRRCTVVDPDDHHLFVSLGCAAENLAQAAAALGQHAHVMLEGNVRDTIRVELEAMTPARSPLFEAIPLRQCTRAQYDGKLLHNAELAVLEQAARGNGVEALMLTDRQRMEDVLDYVIQANTVQVGDPAFVDELKAWIRFSDSEALAARDGLSTRASGNPGLPRWLAGPMFGMFFTAKAENERYARQIRSSAALAVFVSDADDHAHWIEAGRCYERLALQATALGIRNAFVNQAVEVAPIRSQLASFLGIGRRRADLVVRLGRAPAMPPSLRRPLDSVILPG